MTKSLLIVDDETELLDTLKDFFELSDYLVYTAENIHQAQRLLAAEPDLILLDVSMPDIDGITFCRKIRSFVGCPIIFLSAKVDESSRLAGLMAGGDDYLLKPFSLKELGMRVAAHLRREERKKLQQSVSFFGELVVEYDQKQLFAKEQQVPLTKTEFTIVELLAKHPGVVFGREQIYEKIWGFDKEGDESIITEHIRRIRTKVKKLTTQECIHTVWGLGYKWIG
ncbi:response regulator transcription factor [Enterococcus sp. AZ072]|uniref:response regulator transcription factor n=1 Tax=unclassified Enterococcus TaxID=2608891 RepID=UPI003D29C44E